MRILLASSSHTDERTARNVLDQAGYEDVTACYSPEEALGHLDGNTTWDLVITGKHLTEQSGRTLARKIRARARASDLPILMLAGQYTHEEVLSSMRAGVDGFLVFPCSAERLRSKIEDLTASSSDEAVIYQL